MNHPVQRRDLPVRVRNQRVVGRQAPDVLDVAGPPVMVLDAI